MAGLGLAALATLVAARLAAAVLHQQRRGLCDGDVRIRPTVVCFRVVGSILRPPGEAGVAIVPGTAFGKTAKDYVRFSFAASSDNISQALEKIKKMLG